MGVYNFGSMNYSEHDINIYNGVDHKDKVSDEIENIRFELEHSQIEKQVKEECEKYMDEIRRCLKENDKNKYKTVVEKLKKLSTGIVSFAKVVTGINSLINLCNRIFGI